MSRPWRTYYNRALNLIPDDDIAIYMRAGLFARWGNLDGAIVDLQEAVQRNPRHRPEPNPGEQHIFYNLRDDPRFRALVGEDHQSSAGQPV
jgi:hypothetical protein